MSVLAMAACLSAVAAAATCLPPPQDERLTGVAGDDAPALVLSAGSWGSSLAVNHVAALVLRERAGVQVEVRVDPVANPADVVAAMNRGETHVLLESWPAAAQEADAASHVDVLGGGLGIVARVGWYFPSYMLAEYPWLEDTSRYDPSAAATLGDDVFGDRVYAGPESWSSEPSCRDGGLFDNLGLGLNCTRLGGEAELLGELAEHYAAEDPFLIFLWRPLSVFTTYDMVRVKFPCHDATCFDELRCDYPETDLIKLGWAELPIYFPMLAVDFLHNFDLGVDAVEQITDMAVDGSSDAIAEAACLWAGEGDNAAQLEASVRPDRMLHISSVAPTVIPARGGSTLTVYGTGFGTYEPASFGIEVAGRACLQSVWVNSHTAECVTPPSTGELQDVRIRVGARTAVLAAAVSFEAAIVHGFAVVGSGDNGKGGGYRTVHSGQRIIVMGDNFVPSALMRCRIYDVELQATFLNFSAISVTVPALSGARESAKVPIAVTNDGVRWRSGMSLEPLEQMWWAGGVVGVTPLDTSDATSPDEVFLVAVPTFKAPSVLPGLRMAVQHINDDPHVLRHTTLTLLEPDMSGLLDLADLDDRQAALAAIMDDVRSTHPSTLGLIGVDYSSMAMPFARAAGAAEKPWLVMSHSATAPTLSDSAEFPYFLRTVPSDLGPARGLVDVLVFLNDGLVPIRMLDSDNPTVALLYQTDDAFAAGLAEAFETHAASAGFAVSPIIAFAGADLPVAHDDKQHALQDILQPLADSEVRIIAFMVNVAPHGHDVAEALSSIGVADETHLFLQPSMSTTAGLPFNLVVSYVDGDVDDPMRAAMEATVAAESPDQELLWPLALHDSVAAYAHAVDYMISQKRSPHESDYRSADELRSVLRQRAGDWESLTEYGGFSSTTNDPRSAKLGIWAKLGDEPPIVLGSVRDGFVDLVEDGLPTPTGTLSFEPPTHVTIGVAVHKTSSPTGNDHFAIAGIEAAVRELNSLSISGFGGKKNPETGSYVANVTWAIDLVDVAEDVGGVAGALDRLAQRAGEHPAGQRHSLLGVVTLSSSRSLALLAEAESRDLAIMSPTASNDALSDPVAYPLFARVVAGDSHQAAALADLVADFGWSSVATVFIEDEPYSSGLADGIREAAAHVDVEVSQSIGMPSGVSLTAAKAALSGIIEDDIRIFVLLSLPNDACTILRAAADPEVALLGEGFVWLGSEGWIGEHVCSDAGFDDDVEDGVIQAAEGSIGTQPTSTIGQLSELSESGRRVAETGMEQPEATIVGGDDSAVSAVQQFRARNAAMYGSGGSAEGQFDLHFAASRSYDLVLVLSDALTRMIDAKLDAKRGTQLLRFFRKTAGVVGVSSLLSYRPSSNSPAFAPQAVVSRRGTNISTFSLHHMGRHTDRGWIDMAGCAPGTQRMPDATCAPCPENYFKSVAGDVACSPCPANGGQKTTTNGRTGATRRDQCLCPLGLVVGPDPNADFPCVACPTGGICDQLALPLSRVLNQPGWWRGDPNSTTFVECLDEEKCSVVGLTLPVPSSIDGRRVFTSDWTHSTPCAEGGSGVLCEVCVSGYGRDASTGRCMPCSDRTFSVVLLLVNSVIVVMVVIWMAILQLPRAKSSSSRRRAANLKLFLTFLQINSVTRRFLLIWPVLFRHLLTLESDVSAGSVNFVSTDCLIDDVSISAGISQFNAYLVIPLILVTTAACAAGIGAGFRCQRRQRRQKERAMRKTASKSDEQLKVMVPHPTAKKDNKRSFDHRSLLDMWGDLCVNTLNVAVFVLYPTLVVAMLSMFDCVEVPDATAEGGFRSYLRHDFKVRCDDVNYGPLALRAAVAIVAYVIGIPAAYAIVLFRERKVLFHRTLEGAIRPETPVGIVLTQDAEALIKAMKKVAAHETWRRVLSITDKPLTGVESVPDLKYRAARLTRAVRVKFDKIARCVYRSAGISEAELIGKGVRTKPRRRHHRHSRRTGSVSPASPAQGGSISFSVGASIELRPSALAHSSTSSPQYSPLRGRTRTRVFTFEEDATAPTDSEMEPSGPSVNGRRVATFAGSSLEAKPSPGRGRRSSSIGNSSVSSRSSSASNVSEARITRRRSRFSWTLDEDEYRVRLKVLRRQLVLLYSVYDDVMLAVLERRMTVANCVEAAAARLQRINVNQRRFGFVYVQYTQSAYAFELFLLIVKAGMSAVAVLLPRAGVSVQVAAACLLCALALHMLFVYRPSANYSVMRGEQMYLGPRSRMLERFFDLWARKRSNRPQARLDSDVAKVLAQNAHERELRSMPARIRLPEVLTTKKLSYVMLMTTLCNLLLGSVADSNARAWANADGAESMAAWQTRIVFDGLALVLLNALTIAAFVGSIAADGCTMIREISARHQQIVPDVGNATPMFQGPVTTVTVTPGGHEFSAKRATQRGGPRAR